MKYIDHYATLGVSRTADLATITKAYRKLARQTHPDLNKGPENEARFKAAAEAYATLKNPEKRAAYDELGQPPVGQPFTPPPQWQQSHGSTGQAFDDMDLSDLLAAFGRGQGGGRTGNGRQRQPEPEAGYDQQHTVNISLLDAHRGTTLHLNVSKADGGTRTLEVTIPPGTLEGQTLRMRGQGGPGRFGGPAGHIDLHVTVDPHPVFRVHQHDLYFSLALTPWEAVLGTELEVPTLDGPVLLTVPPGTRAGRKLRLKARGLNKRQGGRGDLYATTHIDIPATATEHERTLYQQLAAASNFNPRAHAPAFPHRDAHEMHEPRQGEPT
jgi:curved DNA-binding protein